MNENDTSPAYVTPTYHTSRSDYYSFFEVEVERSRRLEFQLGSLPSVRLQATTRTLYAMFLRDDNVKKIIFWKGLFGVFRASTTSTSTSIKAKQSRKRHHLTEVRSSLSLLATRTLSHTPRRYTLEAHLLEYINNILNTP